MEITLDAVGTNEPTGTFRGIQERSLKTLDEVSPWGTLEKEFAGKKDQKNPQGWNEFGLWKQPECWSCWRVG